MTFLEDNLGQDGADLVVRLLVIALVLLLTWLARAVITAIVPRVVRRLSSWTRTTWDEAIVKALQPPARFLVGLVGLWVALIVLQLPDDVMQVFGGIIQSLVAFGIFWGIYRLVGPVLDISWALTRHTMNGTPISSTLDEKLVRVIRQITQAVVIILGAAAVINSWGYDVAGLVAGLGIGGLAVALAAQDALANLFGYFIILADEPFNIGEYVVFDGISGIVESVGFRSTRIRVLDQSLVTVPNRTVMNASITNWSRLEKRRLNMTLGLEYRSTPDEVLTVVQAIRKMLQEHELVQHDSVTVQFVEFNDSSLDLIIICFINAPDWGDFQAARQDINLHIMRILDEYGIGVAFPSRTLYVEQATSPAAEAAMQKPLPMPEPEPARGTATDSPVPSDAAN